MHALRQTRATCFAAAQSRDPSRHQHILPQRNPRPALFTTAHLNPTPAHTSQRHELTPAAASALWRQIACHAAAGGQTQLSAEELQSLEDLLAQEYEPDRLLLDLEGGVLKLQLAADRFEGMAISERQQLLGQFLDTHAPGQPRELLLMTPREYFAAHLKKWC